MKMLVIVVVALLVGLVTLTVTRQVLVVTVLARLTHRQVILSLIKC